MIIGKSQVAISRTIWTLGYVSLFMDLSSELVHSVFPIFLVGTLGASALTVGFIEGVAVAAAQIVKIFSGALSDFWGHRKRLILIGLLFLIAADLLPAGAATPSAVQVGTGLWGLHMGFTEGILATLVTSVIAGWLGDFRGGSATFYAGTGFSSLVVILTAFGRK